MAATFLASDRRSIWSMTLVKVESGCSVVKDHAICTCCGRLRTVRVCAANLRISSSWVGRGCCESDVLLAAVSDVFCLARVGGEVTSVLDLLRRVS